MGNLEATVASGTVPSTVSGKDWKEYLIGKTTDCIDFVLNSTNLTVDGITEKCDLVIGDPPTPTDGAVKHSPSIELLLSFVVLAMALGLFA
jgi:hypothetical protein